MYRVRSRTDIDRAVRRSRKARAAMRRRQRSAVIAVAISIIATSGALFAVTGVTGSDVVRAATTQAQSLADLFNARSPGTRTEAQLTKTKRARALAKTRAAPRHEAISPNPDVMQMAQLLGPSPPAPVSIAGAVPGVISPPPSLAMIVGSLPGSDVVPPPSNGSGSGPITIPTIQPRELIPAAPVPEPCTWATMLLGFGIIGWRLRRRGIGRALRQSA
jgi:hypothetical protein